jgi:hypothetical protein
MERDGESDGEQTSEIKVSFRKKKRCNNKSKCRTKREGEGTRDRCECKA